MSDQPGGNNHTREYLLGTIETAQREELEARLMVDDDFFDELMLEEEDLIQDYVDNDLAPEEHEAFEKHFLVSDERRSKLKFARSLRKYVDKHHEQKILKPSPGFIDRLRASFRSPAFAVSVAVILALAFAGWFFFLRSTANSRTTAALNRVYTSGRPFESRISDLNYAPFDTVRGATAKTDEPPELKVVEYEVLGKVVDGANTDNLRAFGRLCLAKHEFDEAIKQFEAALKLSPNDARIMNDLGTAYLEKSKDRSLDEQGGQRLKLEAQAYEEFEKAVEINPKLLEARFNRGFCLEALGLQSQAHKAWEEYRALDPSSRWADEAREHIRSLDERQPQSKTGDQLLLEFMDAYRARDDEKAYQIVSRNREMITGKLIPQRLIKSFLDTDEPAIKKEYLEAFKYIGDLEDKKSGDPFWKEMAAFYSSASKEKLNALKEAQAKVFEGYDLSGKNDHEGAMKAFKNASDIFRSNGDKWNDAICGYWIGYTHNRQTRIPESTTVFKQLIAQNEANKWLSSQVLNSLAFNTSAVRQYSKSLEYNERSVILAEKLFDTYLMQKNLSQRAVIYRRLGQYDKAIDSTQKCLDLANGPDASQRMRWRDIDATASLFFTTKFYNSSASFEEEARDLAVKNLDEKTYVYESDINLGRIFSSQGDYVAAFAAFDEGLRIAHDFADGGQKAFAVANAQVLRAHVYRESGDCDSALRDYAESLPFYEGGKYPRDLYEALKGQLQCYSAKKDNAAFEEELPLILDIFRDYRAKIREEQNRNSFFENEQDVYDIAIDHEIISGNFEAAFDYSEESRARSLLDMQLSPVEAAEGPSDSEIKFTSAVTEPLKFVVMQPQIPLNVQILQYTVLKDKILIWSISRESIKAVETDITAKNLETRISAYVALMAKHNPAEIEELNGYATELYKTLIGPVKENLAADKEICIIPDKVLYRVPFAALISPDTGKYFLSEFTFVVTPSLNIFLNSTRRAEALAGIEAEDLLSIGNPAFDEKNFPGLADLGSAGMEAERVAENYDANVVLNGKSALKESVLENLKKANVVHFGGHYIVNDGSPLLSGFVLSDDPNTHKREDSILTNYEILGDRLSNTRLIVLAACDTGAEKYYRGEGMVGAARTFLATGVPLVVASQWAVDTKATAEIMARFHKYRKDGTGSTAQALRRAQLDMLEGDPNFRSPYYWAGFVSFGGHAQF